MPITTIRGKETHTVARDQLDAMIAQYERVVVDLGAGDGKWAYRRAQAHLDELVIAIEPVRENVREASAKASFLRRFRSTTPITPASAGRSG